MASLLLLGLAMVSVSDEARAQEEWEECSNCTECDERWNGSRFEHSMDLGPWPDYDEIIESCSGEGPHEGYWEDFCLIKHSEGDCFETQEEDLLEALSEAASFGDWGEMARLVAELGVLRIVGCTGKNEGTVVIPLAPRARLD